MTIQEMHIGLDLILQRLNSNVFNKLQKEEKDWFLNVTTQELVRAVLLEENNTVFNIVAYTDIRRYYEALQYYIRSAELSVNINSGERFSYGDFPINIPMGIITSGVLYKGITYKFKTLGTGGSFALAFPGITLAANTDYLCNPINMLAATTLVIGETYKIVNIGSGGTSLITSGASSDVPGTVFVATAATLLAGTSLSLERLTVLPTWGTPAAEITPVSNYGYYNYLSSRSAVRYGQSIGSGSLILGKKYIVFVKGTLDLSTYGGKASSDVGYIFTCTTAGTPTWGSTGTVLYEVVEPQNRRCI
jgi:hypothetical protein